MAFVIDGSEWDFNGLTADKIDNLLGMLLERMDVARARRERVWIGDDLMTRKVLAELDIWQLFSPDSPVSLPHELCQELSAALGTIPHYLDETEWPQGMADDFSIAVGSAPPSDNPDLAWAHYHVAAGRAVACLGLRRKGPHLTRSTSNEVQIHWVIDEPTHRNFFRDAIDVERDTPKTLERFAPHAFPDLHFLPDIWSSISNFDGGYSAVREVLRKYLCVLDDNGHWAFTTPPPALTRSETTPPGPGRNPSNQIIGQRFMGLGLDLSPEKPNVYTDRRYRESREREIGGRTLYCEWHAKLQPHINRIYLHPPVPESKDRVIIAIFHSHLPLPG